MLPYPKTKLLFFDLETVGGYPTLSEFEKNGTNFQNSGYFDGVTVYNQFGNVSNAYLPSNFKSCS